MIVPSPCVRHRLGTWSTSPSKKRALSTLVWYVRDFTRVREARDDPGSLNAMCPSVPMPRICRSIPPASAIFCSYPAEAAARSSAEPSGPWTAASAKSTRVAISVSMTLR